MKLHAALITLMLCFLVSSMALAQVPGTMTYHGHLTRNADAVNAPVEVSFKLFDSETGGTTVWEQPATTIDVVDGRFTAILGESSPLDPNVFNGDERWLEVTVGDETLAPRTAVGSMPYSLRAGDAQTIQGKLPSELGGNAAGLDEILSQLSDLQNQVLALQTALDEKANTADVTALQTALQNALSGKADKTDVTALQTALSSKADKTDVTALQTALSSKADETDVTTLQSQVTDQAGKVLALEEKTAPMSVNTIHGKKAVVFRAVNLHVQSGSGSTTSTPNGLGNLVIGYDNGAAENKTGSHNLILGNGHTYTSYGGIVSGNGNQITGASASAIGGTSNEASGTNSVVLAGRLNKATNSQAVVSGGSSNTASGLYSSVSGGSTNTATGDSSSVSGGTYNKAEGFDSSISGGYLNIANGNYSSVTGGQQNSALGSGSSILGGTSNIAEGNYSSIAGGSNNKATAQSTSVSGGYANKAEGNYSSISGGSNLTATSQYQWRAGTYSSP